MGNFFRVSLASHFDLSGSVSVCGSSRDPPVCACRHLSVEVDSTRGLWVVDITYYGVGFSPFLTPKELSSWEGFLNLENENYVVSYLLSGP